MADINPDFSFISNYRLYKGNIQCIPNFGGNKIKEVYKGSTKIWEMGKFTITFLDDYALAIGWKYSDPYVMNETMEVFYDITITQRATNYGKNNYIQTSTDGENWTDILGPLTGDKYSIKYYSGSIGIIERGVYLRYCFNHNHY